MDRVGFEPTTVLQSLTLLECINNIPFTQGYKMNHLNERKNSYFMVAASIATALFALSIIITASSVTATPATASTAAGNNTTTTTNTTAATDAGATTSSSSPLPSSGLELSAQPIWDETVRTTGIFPINQTHSMATFEGNGTMTVPDTGETINMTNNGTAFGNIVPQANNTVVSYGRENVFSVDDGDTSAITFFEIIQYDPATFRGDGLVTAVFDNNATGSLAPFNGMLVVGTHEEDPATQTVIIRLWEWESGIPIPAPNAATTTMGGAPLMNTTTTAIDAATVVETNTTSISEGEVEANAIGGLSEEQQQLSVEEQRQAAEEEEQQAITTAPS